MPLLREKRPCMIKKQRRERHRKHHNGGHVGIHGAADHALRGRGRKQHKGKFAALSHQHRALEGIGVAALASRATP